MRVRGIINRHTRRHRLLGLEVTGALVLGMLAVLAAPTIAFAHAYYVSSTPAANAVLKTAPTSITVHFAENVNPTGSNMVVYDSRGNQVSTAPAQVDPANLKTMTVPMKPDGSEIYLVEWHTVSADDGDPDIGGFTFTVSATASATQASGATNTNATTGTTAHTTSGNTGAPGWLVALIGVLGLIIGGGAGLFFGRRRQAPATATPAKGKPSVRQ